MLNKVNAINAAIKYIEQNRTLNKNEKFESYLKSIKLEKIEDEDIKLGLKILQAEVDKLEDST